MIEGQAFYYDGTSAKRYDVDIGLSNDRLFLTINGADLAAPIHWRLSDLRATRDRGQDETLTISNGQHDARSQDIAMARLVVTDPQIVAHLIKTRPNLFKREIKKRDRSTFFKRFGIAVVAIVVMIFVILPGLAGIFAQLLPVEREVALGRSSLSNMERAYSFFDEEEVTYCSSPKGDAALRKLTATIIGDQDIDYDLDIRVMNNDMINAFALPGGIVILMKGLLDSSDTVEATAGVLAHEIGHVVERHTVKGVLYTSSMAGILSMVFGDLSGGTVLAIFGEQLAGSRYSRNAETEADIYAIKSLTEANIDLNGFASFFDLISGMEPDFMDNLSYLSTHPVSDNRAQQVRDEAQSQQSHTSPLSAEEWAALKSICD